MTKAKPIPVVYHDEFCNTFYEVWANFKAHMIDEHEIDPDWFVNAPKDES